MSNVKVVKFDCVEADGTLQVAYHNKERQTDGIVAGVMCDSSISLSLETATALRDELNEVIALYEDALPQRH